MPLFTKKPVTIEARQVGNDYDEDLAIMLWCGGEQLSADESETSNLLFRIPTLEGAMEVTPGDWVIRGIKGEFYPCKPDVFADSYEEAE
jgi:hypothetical protein